MQKIVALIVAVGLVMAFGGAALAGGSGECNYGSQVNQAAADKADTSKTVATKSAEKADADKLTLAQTDKEVKPAPETKK